MSTSKTRRGFLKGSGAAFAAMGVGALGGGVLSPAAQAAPQPGVGGGAPAGGSGRVRKDGTYATVPLAKPRLMLGVVQARVRAVDASSAATASKGVRENLKHMLRLIDRACYMGSKPDWLHFHEFVLTGWDAWTREEALRAAIQVPGPETAEISKKAKQYGCYITFGTYARDDAWPDHVLSLTVTIGPDGEIVARDWKGGAEDLGGATFDGIQMFTTTIYSVMDRYIEMYGRDALVPVHRTPLGNFATTQMQRAPEMYRAMALKGAEFVLATATGGFSAGDLASSARNNRIYVAMANNALSPDNGNFFDETGGAGGCAVWGPTGLPVAEAKNAAEQVVKAVIPIGDFRATRCLPHVHSMALVQELFNDYELSYPPNLFSEYLPDTLQDSARYLKSKSRWK